MTVLTNSPEVLGGAVVFTGTRVPVRNLFDYLMAGDSIKNFLEDFPSVSFEQIRHVLQSAEVAVEKMAA